MNPRGRVQNAASRLTIIGDYFVGLAYLEFEVFRLSG
jgi:hypothetical protein